LAATALLSGVVSVAAMVWSSPGTAQGASGTGHRGVKSLEGQVEPRVQNAMTDVFKTDIRLNSVWPNSRICCNLRWHTPLGKGDVSSRTDYKDPEVEYRYSSTLSLTSGLDGMVVNATCRLF
jgi:hypothetical protein